MIVDILIKTIFPSVTIGVITAVCTVWFSLKRFQKERWWQLKAEAYSRIIEALYHVMAYYSEMEEDTLRDYGASDSSKLSQKVIEELEEKSFQASKEIDKATGMGAFIISDEVSKVLHELKTREGVNPREEPWLSHCNDQWRAYQKTIDDIRRLAKKDLKV
ncbi:MAG: hypothetical protein V1746_08195 [bacterium]